MLSFMEAGELIRLLAAPILRLSVHFTVQPLGHRVALAKIETDRLRLKIRERQAVNCKLL
jgi:hypothetical protein